MHLDWRRIETLFGDAIDLSPDQRAAYLDAHCAGDAALRAEVESLLANAAAVFAHEDGRRGGFGARLRSAMADAAEDFLDVRGQAEHIGPYRLLLLVDEDRVSQVYLAERSAEPRAGLVTLKLLRPALGTSHGLAQRLHDERRILDQLHHPAIVRALDGGTTDAGVPYLVTEHIDGVRLDRYASSLTVRERVALIRRVCEPIAYAHAHRVVHRDLEPSNVLVTADAQPKISGFGGAELLAPGHTGAVASDVYALGALLHIVLSGHTDASGDPPRPSTVAAPRDRRAIAGDLDAIVMRALRRDPAARHASVAALSEDLGRYLDGQPIQGREPTIAEHVRTLASRHRVALALAALIALTAAIWSLRT